MGFRVQDFRFGVQGLGSRDEVTSTISVSLTSFVVLPEALFAVQRLAFSDQGLRSSDFGQGCVFGVQGSGFKVWGLWFGDLGLGSGV